MSRGIGDLEMVDPVTDELDKIKKHKHKEYFPN